MKPLIPYLFFNGNCREAMNFYQQCFGGKLELMPYSNAPEAMQNACGNGAKDQIMHSSLTNDSFMLMASDWPDGKANQGNNISLNIQCETIDEIENLFKKLSVEGKITQPLSDTFWDSRFGMLIDKYDIHWMLNCPLTK